MNTKSILITLLFPILTFAQIGIGTSTIDASAKLQVDATNKGFLQPRVALTGTADTATIATPATGLMVFNTATAGTGATAVTPGVYYYSGSAWQRVANQADVAAATATTATYVSGDLGTPYNGHTAWLAFAGGSSKTCNASITLPPGKWEVVLNLTCMMVDYDTQWGIPISLSMSYWLQNDQTPDPLYYNYPTSPNLITADVLFPGAGMFTKPVGGIGSLGTEHNGSFYINNTTTNSKTYYLYFHEGGIADTQNSDGFEPGYAQLGGSTWKGNRFYAVKIN